jgi:hypothetical protein
MTFPAGGMDTIQKYLQAEGFLFIQNIYIPGNGVDVSNEAGNTLSLAKTGVKLQYQSSNGIRCSTVWRNQDFPLICKAGS